MNDKIALDLEAFRAGNDKKVGKNGVKGKIGTGGTNLSIGNVLGAIQGGKAFAKSSQVRSYVSRNFGTNENVENSLRSLYGFGDERQNKLLNDILNTNGDVTGYNFETRENYMGTYNYGSGLYHLALDMIPYWKWGNTPDDLFGSKAQGIEATPFLRRLYPEIQNTIDSHNKMLLENKDYALYWYWQSRNYMY